MNKYESRVLPVNQQETTRAAINFNSPIQYVFTFTGEMAMTTSYQRSILKIQKSIEVLIYTQARTINFVHIFEFYVSRDPVTLRNYLECFAL